MVVSVNNEPNRKEFEMLLDVSLLSLKNESAKNQANYLALLGNKLEDKVYDILSNNAKGTIFEGSIELISGQRFPDIIAKKYYGVEVKTTKSNHWKSTGSSILESTRVEGIERIFMLFGKMVAPVEFMCRPYEDCLSEVVVTHSPRYLIDMNLAKGKTIFDKIEVPYDILRKQPNPIKTVLDYYRKQLKAGDDVWYLDQDNNGTSTNLIIKMWNNLTIPERNELIVKGFCLFPELISNRIDKFNRFALWLATRQGVICPNVRDPFTAGGQGIIEYEGLKFSNIPQIVMRLYYNIELIKAQLMVFSYEELLNYWGIGFEDKDRYFVWKELIINNSALIIKNNLPLNNLLK